MTNRAAFAVLVDGQDISPALAPVILSIRVSDKAGTSSDTASIEIDDKNGAVVLPPKGAKLEIRLGFVEAGIGTVFRGTIDELRSRGDRGGRMLSISAKGVDTSGKAKERRQKHFDKKSIQDIMSEAGKDAGISDVKVDPAFASTVREYERMDDESFIAFGERLARELGGTFKVSGERAVLAKRNGGTAPGGQPLPTVTATWGQNLLSWDIAPYLGRGRFKEARTRYYDPKTATWKEVKTQTEIEDAEATITPRFPAANEQEAGEKTKADAAESARMAGEGTVIINGNIGAQPEGELVLSGTRDGIDGTYRIDGVDHEYSRSGFTTSLSLKQPGGEAGKDSRSKSEKKKKADRKKKGGNDDFKGLAPDKELGGSGGGGDFEGLPDDPELG